MRSTRSAWGWSIGAVVLLVGGLMIADYGPAATPAAAAPPVDEDPNAGVTKNWNKKLPNTSRFTVLTDFGGAAMRDNETGLVWEQSPETKTQNWSGARFHCTRLTTGGRNEVFIPPEPATSKPEGRAQPDRSGP